MQASALIAEFQLKDVCQHHKEHQGDALQCKPAYLGHFVLMSCREHSVPFTLMQLLLANQSVFAETWLAYFLLVRARVYD